MSILVDTNVLSELLRPSPETAVIQWWQAQSPEHLYVSAVTQSEMMLGARLLPSGKRRRALEEALAAMFDEDFAHKVLPFDGSAVPAYVDIVADRRSRGRPISQFDAQIAAIASRHGSLLATRNGVDFEHCGVALVDPWAFQG